MNPPNEGLPKDYRISTPPNLKKVLMYPQGRCILCGKEVEGGGVVCGKCKKKYPDDKVLSMDSLYMLSTISLILAFIIVLPSNWTKSIINPQLKSDGYFLFLTILALITLIIPPIKGFKLFIRKRFIEAYLYILGNFLFFTSLILFINSFHLLSVILIIPGFIFICFSYKMFLTLKLPHTIIFIIACLSLDEGFLRSLNNVGNVSSYWLLSNTLLIFIGITLLIIFSFFFLRYLDIITISAIPFGVWGGGVLLTGVALLKLNGGGIENPWLLIALFLGFIWIIMGLGMMIQKRFIEEEMEKNVKKMRRALIKAKGLVKDGYPFYALQQLDRIISLNIISGLGSSWKKNNILFRIEKISNLRHVDSDVGEYEIAFNEKAKILLSQYKITEAISTYMDAIKRNPNYLDTYLNLAWVLSSIPGKLPEATKYINYYLTAKRLHLSRWFGDKMPLRYINWAEESNNLFEKAIDLKRDIISSIRNPSEIASYYSTISTF